MIAATGSVGVAHLPQFIVTVSRHLAEEVMLILSESTQNFLKEAIQICAPFKDA